MERASFKQRLAAALVDYLLIWGIVIGIGWAAIPGAFLDNAQGGGPSPLLFATGLGVLMIYHWLFTALSGQTLGKRLLKIRVVDTHDKRPTWIRALWRESFGRVAMLISLLIEGIFLIISNMTAYSLNRTTIITFPEYGYRKSRDREPASVLDFFDRFSGTKVIKLTKPDRSGGAGNHPGTIN